MSEKTQSMRLCETSEYKQNDIKLPESAGDNESTAEVHEGTSQCDSNSLTDTRKKRAADCNDQGDSSKAVSPKKTRLFGSISREGTTKGNFFSSALNKLASQNIDIKPLAPSKVDFVDDANEDSRMSWTAETPKVFGDANKKAVVKEIIVETGEEEEETVLEVLGKLYMFSSECGMWKERGRGVLKLNDRKNITYGSVPQSRLVMRSTGTLRLLLNSNLFSKMDVTRTSISTVRFSAQQAGALRIFSIKASAADCDRLMDELQFRVEQLASGCSEDRQEIPPKSIDSEGSRQKWLETWFTKPCTLISDQQSNAASNDNLVLVVEKDVNESDEACRNCSEYITLKRNVDDESGKSENIVFQCPAADMIPTLIDNVKVSLEIPEKINYVLKFENSSDATEVFSIWQNTVGNEETSTSSSQNSSSSYESAKSDETSETAKSNESS